MVFESDLRTRIIKQRMSLNKSEQHTLSKKIAAHIESLPLFQQSQHIAFYIAVNGEANSHPLLELAWAHNKNCYLPTLDTTTFNTLHFLPYASDTILQPNRYDIPEPIINEATTFFPTEQLDLILTPLVAFDPNGNRLGMGGGYYDRTFAFLKTPKEQTSSTPQTQKPTLLGLAYEFQKVDHLPPEDWDVPLTITATDIQIYSHNK